MPRIRSCQSIDLSSSSLICVDVRDFAPVNVRFTFSDTVAFRSFRYPVLSLRLQPFRYDRFPERNQKREKKKKDSVSLSFLKRYCDDNI